MAGEGQEIVETVILPRGKDNVFFGGVQNQLPR